MRNQIGVEPVSGHSVRFLKNWGNHPIYNLRFALVCLSSYFFSASFNMLIPELPAYLSQMGGAEYKGLIISLFTLTAGLSRPFSGRLTDTLGRKPVMFIGAFFCVICGFLYPVLGTVAGFLFLRLMHGFSTGFSPTAYAAYVSDIVPANKWGEALGLQSIFFSVGMASGPALGSYIKLYYSFEVLFYSSSLLAFCSIAFMLALKETVGQRKPLSWDMIKITRHDIFAREVLPPSIVIFLSYLAFGSILTLIPDWSDGLGFANKGLFFVVFTLSSVLVRFIAGKASDRNGRVPVIIVGLVGMVFSLSVMGSFESQIGLMVAATLYGLSLGILSPALNAWTVDLSPTNARGKGIATMFIALEAGIGFGAFFSGWYYQDVLSRIPIVFYVCAVANIIALGYIIHRSHRQRQTLEP
jgi:MFS family permease